MGLPVLARPATPTFSGIPTELRTRIFQQALGINETPSPQLIELIVNREIYILHRDSGRHNLRARYNYYSSQQPNEPINFLLIDHQTNAEVSALLAGRRYLRFKNGQRIHFNPILDTFYVSLSSIFNIIMYARAEMNEDLRPMPNIFRRFDMEGFNFVQRLQIPIMHNNFAPSVLAIVPVAGAVGMGFAMEHPVRLRVMDSLIGNGSVFPNVVADNVDMVQPLITELRSARSVDGLVAIMRYDMGTLFDHVSRSIGNTPEGRELLDLISTVIEDTRLTIRRLFYLY